MQLEQVLAGQTVFKLSNFIDNACKSVSNDVWNRTGSRVWISSTGRKRDCVRRDSKLQKCYLDRNYDVLTALLQIFAM